MVNISSGAAVKGYPTWSLYCSTRAAREMFTQCVAKEGVIKTMNYSPGPVETDMQVQISTEAAESDLKARLGKMLKEGKLVKPEDTADKLLRTLVEDGYESGNRVEYR